MTDMATQTQSHILSDMWNMAECAIIIDPVNSACLMLNTCQYGDFQKLHKLHVQTGAAAQSAHFHLTLDIYNIITLVHSGVVYLSNNNRLKAQHVY